MMTVTLYQPATGQIGEVLTGPATDVLRNISPRFRMIEGDWPADRYYIAAGRPHLRPALSLPDPHLIADGLQVWSVDGLPAGTRASVSFSRDANGAAIPREHPNRFLFAGEISDGQLELATMFAGTYRVVLVPPHPWQRAEFEITAVAP